MLKKHGIPSVAAIPKACGFCLGNVLFNDTHGEPGRILFCPYCEETGEESLIHVNIPKGKDFVMLKIQRTKKSFILPAGATNSSRIYMMAKNSNHRRTDDSYTSVSVSEYKHGKRPEKKVAPINSEPTRTNEPRISGNNKKQKINLHTIFDE